ncbi:peptidase family M48-domain-containing protein [Obelidium mucronatum]|nr:peptidase family M48-domain-containing protein [Obelidium mucronatum]
MHQSHGSSHSASASSLWAPEKTLVERLFSLDWTVLFSSERDRRIPRNSVFTDTLAAVLAHEMAHVLSRHSAEDMGVSQFFQLFLDAAHSILYTLNVNMPFLADLSGRAVDAAAPYLSTLPYSRLMEIEADVVGLFLMSVAGFNPQRASEFWKFLAKTDERQHQFAEFMSTHPSHQHRAIELAKHEAAAFEIYRAHKRIEDALKLLLARLKKENNSAYNELAIMSTANTTTTTVDSLLQLSRKQHKVESELDHLNHAMYHVLQQFVQSHDTFWYARKDFDAHFVEESLKIVDEMEKKQQQQQQEFEPSI